MSIRRQFILFGPYRPWRSMKIGRWYQFSRWLTYRFGRIGEMHTKELHSYIHTKYCYFKWPRWAFITEDWMRWDNNFIHTLHYGKSSITRTGKEVFYGKNNG